MKPKSAQLSKMKSYTFRQARGGWSRILVIICEKCNTTVCRYQKDGPGPLKRMYWDRIIDVVPSKDRFVCSHCGADMGVKIVYEKEKRIAYRLFQDSIKKSIIKAS